MQLYEVAINRTGESYVRRYAWSDSAEHARQAALDKARVKYGNNAEVRDVVLMCAEGQPAFVSAFSDCGFEMEG